MEVYDTFPVVSIPKGAQVSALAVLGDTVYVGVDDGSLRVIVKKEAIGARPTFDVREVLSRFSKDKKAVRALHAVPEWNLLIDLIDGVVASHSLNALSKPPLALPAAKGTHAVAPNAELGILCCASRTSVRLLEWQGVAAPAKGAAPGPVFSVIADRELLAILPASAAFASSERKRRGSFIGLPLPLPPPSRTGTPLLCITSVTWVGVLLCIGVIRRADVSLHEEVDDVPVVHLVGGPAPGGDGESDTEPDEPEQLPAATTGFALSYLFMHPWTGRLVREVRCGPAPPLDNAGFPVASRREAGEAGPPGAPAPSPDVPGNGPAAEEAAANVTALLGEGWTAPLLGGALGGGAAGSKALGAGGARSPIIPSWGPVATLREPSAAPHGPGASGRGHGPRGQLQRRGSLDSTGSADSLTRGAGTSSGAPHDRDRDGAVVVVCVSREPPPSALDPSGAPAAHCALVPGLYMVGATLTADGLSSRGEDLGAGGGDPGAGDPGALTEGAATPISFSSYPVALYASGSFPYVVAAQAEGLTVYNARTGGEVQRIKLPNVRGFAGCPEEVRARLNFAAGRVGGAGGAPDGGGSVSSLSGGGMTPEYILRVVSQPERLYAFVGSGVVMLRMVPVVMQVASLLSARPPEFEAALALCEHFRDIRMRVRGVEAAQRLAGEAAAAASAAGSRRGSLAAEQQPPGDLAAGVSAALVQRGGRPPRGAAAPPTDLSQEEDLDPEEDEHASSSGGAGGGAAASGYTGAGGGGVDDEDDDLGEEEDRAFKALGGVPGSKIRQIRAQFGYQLFARGDFGQALFHLSHAGEPPGRILSLFPQLLPAGVHLCPHLPVAMPVMIDATLPAAVKPLIPYLLLQRRRLRCHLGRVVVHDDPAAENEGGGLSAPPSARGGGPAITAPAVAAGEVGRHIGDLLTQYSLLPPSSGSSGGPPQHLAPPRRLPSAVLVDTVLLTAFLWNEAQVAAEYAAALGSGPSGGPMVPASASYAASLRAELSKTRRGANRLLASPNCVDLEEAEVQLRAFRGGGEGGRGGGSELVVLFKGKGAHASAVRILARGAEDAMYAAGILQHEAGLAARGAAPASSSPAPPPRLVDHAPSPLDATGVAASRSGADALAASAREVALHRVHALTAFLRGVGHPHEALVLPHLRSLLEGHTLAGVEGVLLALAALMPPISLIRRGATEAAAASARAAKAASRAGAKALVPAPAVASSSSSGEARAGRYAAAKKQPFAPLDFDAVVAFLSQLNCRYACSSSRVEEEEAGGSLERGILCAMWRLRGASPLPSDADPERLTTLLFTPAEAEGGPDDDPELGGPAAAHWSTHLLIAYLEFVVYAAGDAGVAPRPLVHAAAALLAQQYLAVYAALLRGTPALASALQHKAGAQAGKLGVYRRRLMLLLQHQPALRIDDAAALGLLPPAAAPAAGVSFAEERVLLLRRLGQHEAALRILVRSLGDSAAAEEYCAEVRRGAEERAAAAVAGGLLGMGGSRPRGDPGDAKRAAADAAAGEDSAERRAVDMDVYNALLRAYLNSSGAAGVSEPAGGGGALLLLQPRADAAAGLSGPSLRPRTALPPATVAEIGEEATGALFVVSAAGAGDGRAPAAPSALSIALLGYTPHYSQPEQPLAAAASTARACAPALKQQPPLPDVGSATPDVPATGDVVSQVMDIMSRNFNRVDASAALGALPPSIPLSAVAPFLVSAIRHSQDSVRAVAVAEQLNNAMHLKVRAELLEKQARPTVIERNTACCVCKRRLAAGGNLSVFTIQPDGKIAHLACLPKPA